MQLGRPSHLCLRQPDATANTIPNTIANATAAGDKSPHFSSNKIADSTTNGGAWVAIKDTHSTPDSTSNINNLQL